jgi:hypothetical protein
MDATSLKTWGNAGIESGLLQSFGESLMSYIDDYLPINKQFEGDRAWMYLDSKGNVTTACGLLLASSAAAVVLPFQAPDFSRAATAIEIIANFNFVKASHVGYVAEYYQVGTSPVLTAQAMEQLQRAKVMQFDVELRKRFPKFDNYPNGVKMALLDMDYNLGDERERETYVHFDAAVLACDWLHAAAQCGRDVSDPAFEARNAWTKLQFMNALGQVTQ